MEPLTLPFSGSTPISRHLSAMAAVEAARTRATKSARYLVLLSEAGDSGLSDHEASAMTGWPLSTLCSIRNGCFPLIWPSARTAASPYHSDLQVTCWRLASDHEVAINRMKRAKPSRLREAR